MNLVRFYTDENGVPLDLRGLHWHFKVTTLLGDHTLCGVMLDGSNNYAWHTKTVDRTTHTMCPECLKIIYACRAGKFSKQDLSVIPEEHRHKNSGRKHDPETLERAKLTKRILGINGVHTSKKGQGKIYDDGVAVYRDRANPKRT
ncbi:hypothetical protein [Vibrio phage D4]|nr:hypothetical protein [Vibrio phage D4]WKV32805.1 hypothetical protein R21Y_44 [Vibrio phage vB_VhaS_R21Y]